MRSRVQEKTKEEIERRLSTMLTDLSKVEYLESAIKEDFSPDVKRFLWKTIADIYEVRGMFEKSAKAFFNKAGLDVVLREKFEDYVKAGELYARAGKPDMAEEMFVVAMRDANAEQRTKIRLAIKNIFMVCAENFERIKRRITALQLYEHLIKLPNLEEIEKQKVKQKLISIYNSLGKFREGKMAEGL
jgi:tetratricopeptide (TPR) repeat protein